MTIENKIEYNEEGTNITPLIEFLDLTLECKFYTRAYNFLNKSEVKEVLPSVKYNHYTNILKEKGVSPK